jgi:S1-C subfamily serine protease
MKTERILIGFSVLVLAALACQAGAAPIVTTQPPVAAATLPPASVSAPAANPAAQQDVLVALYRQVSPGIVAIKVVGPQGASLGSGFVYDTGGHIVTNYHVVQEATDNKVEVDFMSGYKSYGTVVGTDLDSDLAIVKVDAPAAEFHPLPLGDSSTLQVGQTVIAIGNPFGLNGTMTVGIISALGRTLDSEHATPGGGQPFTAGDIIQTDAAINPGNSGGPLFNINGEVIGVNRAIRTTSYTSSGDPVNSGIGFAVSSNIIQRVTPVLISDGKYDYPYLGMSSQSDLSLDEIDALGLKQYTGAYVTSVVQGGPADQAGLRAGDRPTSIQGLNAGGDLIIAIDGHEIHQFDELLAFLITHKSPGDTVVLTVIRDGQKQDITVTLGKRPS